MKKKFIGALAALALTVSMASPVLAATETYSTQAAKTSTSTPGAAVETLTDTSSKQIETLSTNVATDASKYVDSSKTVATAPTLAVEIINTGLASGDTTTEWYSILVNEELGNGTYLVAHIKADGSTEYQVVTAVNGKVSLTLHGASPLAFYAITAKAKQARQRPRLLRLRLRQAQMHLRRQQMLSRWHWQLYCFPDLRSRSYPERKSPADQIANCNVIHRTL